jgi:hypothetical protein
VSIFFLVVPSPDFSSGVLANVLETTESVDMAKRVELFAKAREKVFGILHTFFVAYSSEKALLEVAEGSSNVVQVRTFRSQDGSSPASILQDYLILKRTCPENQEKPLEAIFPYRAGVPEILVPLLWSVRMRLKTGDKIVICKPPGEYSIAPPEV